MRAVVQRVSSASVSVDGSVRGAIGHGLLVLLGVTHTDSAADAERLATKVVSLRIFDDAEGRMNLDVRQAGGSVLAISQFTLYGDTRRGNRPSYTDAAPGTVAEPLYDAFCAAIAAAGIPCERGAFGAEMAVTLVNDGPVTIWQDTAELAGPRG